MSKNFSDKKNIYFLWKKDCTNKKKYYINIKKMRIQELERICKKCPKKCTIKKRIVNMSDKIRDEINKKDETIRKLIIHIK